MDSIRVTFIESATGRMIGEADLPADQLPESFAEPSTMHLGDDDWEVERADPVDRAGYIASKRLTLTLQRILMVDPSTIRYSLATIEDTLPPMMEGDTKDVFELREDDWRQREFISDRFASQIAAELEDIRAVYAAGDGLGFEEIHIRSRIAEPLAGVDVPISALQAVVGEATQGPLAIAGDLVKGGFTFAIRGAVVYGRLERGQVVTLGLAQGEPPRSLLTFATHHGLLVVDWLEAHVKPATT